MKNLNTLPTENHAAAIYLYNEQKLNTLIFYILLWFGGLFGAHLFYKGVKVKRERVKFFVWGVIYIFTFGGFGILWLLDLVFGWYGVKLSNEEIAQEIIDSMKA